MPITPLHFGVMAPINHKLPGKVNNTSFILANLAIDGHAIINVLMGLPLPAHTPLTHSVLSACVLAALISLLRFRSAAWLWGAWLGAITHIFLDMFVHVEMQPFYPFVENPFFMGWMEPMSWALLPLMLWAIVQYVPASMKWLKETRAKAQSRKNQSSKTCSKRKKHATQHH